MKKNYFYNAILTLSNVLFPILSFPYASRLLGPEGIGKAQFIFSFSMYFSVLAALGLPTYGIREIAKVKGNKRDLAVLFNELLSIHGIASLALTLMYLLVIFYVPFFRADRTLYLVALVPVLFGFAAVDWLYSGLEKFKIIAVRSVAFKFISLIFLYVFVRGRADAAIYLYILLFTVIGNNLVNIFSALWYVPGGFHLKISNFKKHVRPLFFIFGTVLATSIYTLLDSVLLGFLSNETQVGYYTAAMRFTKLVIPFITSASIVLVPALSVGFAENDQATVSATLGKSFAFIAFFSVPVTVGLIVLSPEIIVLFSGEHFVSAIPSMRILSLLPVLVGASYFYGFQVLTPSGRERELMIAVSAGLIVSLAFNFLLVPRWQSMGASIANVSAEIAVCYLLYWFSRRSGYRSDGHAVLAAIASSLLFVPVIYLIKPFVTQPWVFLLFSFFSSLIIYIGAQWMLFNSKVVRDAAITFQNVKRVKKDSSQC